MNERGGSNGRIKSPYKKPMACTTIAYAIAGFRKDYNFNYNKKFDEIKGKKTLFTNISLLVKLKGESS